MSSSRVKIDREGLGLKIGSQGGGEDLPSDSESDDSVKAKIQDKRASDTIDNVKAKIDVTNSFGGKGMVF